jgi:hypothetical protein
MTQGRSLRGREYGREWRIDLTRSLINRMDRSILAKVLAFMHPSHVWFIISDDGVDVEPFTPIQADVVNDQLAQVLE